jgi:hypothetical protein
LEINGDLKEKAKEFEMENRQKDVLLKNSVMSLTHKNK